MAVEAVSGPNSGADFETLIAELNHPVWEVRRDACEEMGLRGDKRAISYLVRMLHDGVGAVRFSAAEALGKLGDHSVVPHLTKLLEDPHFGAYGPVVEALANLKSPEAIPHFIRMLRDADPRLRGLASNALMVITRQVIPFKAKGTDEERDAAVQQWELWWKKNETRILAAKPG
jgi:HEAT repeat protein